MKKVYVLMLALAVVCCLPVTAQVKFGIKGGLDVTSMSMSSDVLNSENREGFYIGPTVKVSLLDTGFGVDASALYDQRSGKIKAGDDNSQTGVEESLTQKQIAIPINLRYAFGIGSMANVFLFAGPQFGFNVGSDKDNINWKWKDSSFSVNVGAGVTVLNHLQFNVNYNIACGKTGEIKPSEVLPEVTKNMRARYNAWQVGLAYYF